MLDGLYVCFEGMCYGEEDLVRIDGDKEVEM